MVVLRHRPTAGVRQRGCSPQQLFGWRRQAQQSAAGAESEAPKFVPTVVETAPPAGVALGRRRKRTHHIDRISGLIEVEIEGVTARIGRGGRDRLRVRVLRALKAGP